MEPGERIKLSHLVYETNRLSLHQPGIKIGGHGGGRTHDVSIVFDFKSNASQPTAPHAHISFITITGILKMSSKKKRNGHRKNLIMNIKL